MRRPEPFSTVRLRRDSGAKALFLLRELRPGAGCFAPTGDGNSKLNAYLEDYAFLIDGLIALHEVTLDVRWLREAAVLGDEMVELFWDEASGRFYDTGRDHEELIVRPHDVTDNAIPSGSSMAATRSCAWRSSPATTRTGAGGDGHESGPRPHGQVPRRCGPLAVRPGLLPLRGQGDRHRGRRRRRWHANADPGGVPELRFPIEWWWARPAAMGPSTVCRFWRAGTRSADSPRRTSAGTTSATFPPTIRPCWPHSWPSSLSKGCQEASSGALIGEYMTSHGATRCSS